MNWREKIFIAAWILVMLLVLVAIPLPPVHKVNPACCSADACVRDHHHGQKTANEPLTDKQLQAWFDGVNEEYFLGRLPVAEVKWADLTAQKDIGLSTQRTDGSWTILLDRTLNQSGKQAEFTIYHEICHLATDDLDHGSKWQGCMLRLANKGAFEGIW